MTILIRVLLIILLLLCLADMPYGYYQFVRFSAFAGFGWLALDAGRRNEQQTLFIYAALALLFQPIFKISLGRSIWNMVDLIVAVGLILSLLKSGRRK